MVNRAVAKIKIVATPEVVDTVRAYTKALQFCVNVAWNNKIRNNVKLHHVVYGELRSVHKLPAQLAVACIKQACGMVKKGKTKPVIKKACVGYNFPRSANLKGDVLAIRTLSGRQEFNIKIPDCYKEYFSWKINESLLRLDKKGRAFFLFTFSKEPEVVSLTTQNVVLGIDLGIKNLAVTSDGKFFNSSIVKQVKRRFKFLRSKLQAKGTRAAKHLLREISGRETRFMAWYNHNISKAIVSRFKAGDAIVMENLKGIRKVWRGKRMNYWISNWSFYQLQSFIQYKAARKGINMVVIRPSYTSKLCSKCGKLASRNCGFFSCSHCGFSLNADLNAARNIAYLAHNMLDERQAAVNQPHISSREAEASLTG